MSGSDDGYEQTILAPERRGAITLRHFLGSLRGSQNRFDSGVLHLGRRKDCDVRYDSAIDRMVSGRHARLTCENGSWTIEDLGSTNGTLVNGESVVGRVKLKHGDCVVLGLEGTDGSASFTIEIAALAPGESPPTPTEDFPETGFTYDCPGCGALVPAPLSSIGLFARCLHCGNDHRVPRPGAPAEAVAEPAAPAPRGGGSSHDLRRSLRADERMATPRPIDAPVAPNNTTADQDPARLAELEAALEQANRGVRRAAADLASVMWHSATEIDWSRCKSVPSVLEAERSLQDAASHVDHLDEELRRNEVAHKSFVADSEKRRADADERLERARHDKRAAESERAEAASQYEAGVATVVERLDRLSLLLADFVARQRPTAEPTALSDLDVLRQSLRTESDASDPDPVAAAQLLTRRDAAAQRVARAAEDIVTAERVLASIAKEGAAHDAKFNADRDELELQLERATASLAQARTELGHRFAQLGCEAVENGMPECARHPQERANYDDAIRALEAARAARGAARTPA